VRPKLLRPLHTIRNIMEKQNMRVTSSDSLCRLLSRHTNQQLKLSS
jgi:hypothetical protein